MPSKSTRCLNWPDPTSPPIERKALFNHSFPPNPHCFADIVQVGSLIFILEWAAYGQNPIFTRRITFIGLAPGRFRERPRWAIGKP